MFTFLLSAGLGLLICISVERQLPFQGGRLVAFAIATGLATVAAGFLTSTLGAPGLIGGAIGAGAGLLLGSRQR